MSNTQDEYRLFTGTLHYYEFNSTYAYTDGIKFLKDHLTNDLFYKIIEQCIDLMSYKNPFGSFTIHVTDNTIYVKAYDDEGDETCTAYFCNYDKENKNLLTTLDEGVYKIFIYKYVILASTEY